MFNTNSFKTLFPPYHCSSSRTEQQLHLAFAVLSLLLQPLALPCYEALCPSGHECEPSLFPYHCCCSLCLCPAMRFCAPPAMCVSRCCNPLAMAGRENLGCGAEQGQHLRKESLRCGAVLGLHFKKESTLDGAEQGLRLREVGI